MPAIVEFETIPQLFNNLVRYWDGQERPALSYRDRATKEWTDIPWEELARRVHAFAGYLHSRGVRKGDRVAILAENRPEWAITDLATQLLGAVNVSLYTSLPADQVAYILRDSGSVLFVVSTGIQLKKAEAVFDELPDLQEVVTMTEPRDDAPAWLRTWDEVIEEGAAYWEAHADELRPLAGAVGPDDLCALIYTSGTTGEPKGVMLTHRNFCSNTHFALRKIPFGPEDHHLSFLPLCHSFERTAGYTAVLACGARITYAESIDAVSKNLQEVGPTVMISVPRLFEKIYNLVVKSVEEGSAAKQKVFAWAMETGKKAAHARKNGRRVGPLLGAQRALAHRLVFAKLHERLGGNLRFAVSGGAALPKSIGEFFEAAGVTIVEGYGLTETAPVLAFNPVDHPRYGTVGHVLPGTTIGIQRVDDGTLLAELAGDDYPSSLSTGEGEIVARGPNIMKGYWNNEAATAEAIDDAGWYHTGDVGRFDDGYLVITDRIKHMIVSQGGKNIYPGPIEDRFKTVALVDQILIVGEGREFLTALVVPDLDGLRAYAREQGIEATDTRALLNHPDVRKVFEKEFRAYSKSAAAHEKIRDFRLLEEPFTVENEMMTPTLKPRRRIIETRYADLIEEMYAAFGER